MEAVDAQSKEIRELRACIGDLLGVLALPAVWAGMSSARLAGMLADVLTDTLRADYVLVRLHDDDQGAPIEAVRTSATWPSELSSERLPHWPASLAELQTRESSIEHNGNKLSYIWSRIGLQDGFGIAVVGAFRADFPQRTERLLLKATLNQALVCLQDNARIAEQQRRAIELDRLVSLKTAELADNAQRTQALQEELAHANRVATIGQLSAAISHELRQPLQSVVTSGNTALNWLQRDPGNVVAIQRSLNRIVAEGFRAAEILDRTRSLMKKETPQRESVDLNTVINDTMNLVMAHARLKRVVIHTSLAERLPPILADRIQLQQVILNLMLNAMEAVAAHDASAREVHLTSSHQAATAVQITIQDSGTGIAPEHFDRLFDAFFTTKPDGMGLGLAICRSIIESHDGSLWAESDRPHGATFHVSLPLQEAGRSTT